MDDNNRFSIVLLEKDILEYREYKQKYSKYENKLKTRLALIYKSEYETKRNYFYNKYIKKIRYLERKYRCNNIYTNYHSQLEDNNLAPSYNENKYNENKYNESSYNVLHAVVVPESYLMPSAPLASDINELPIVPPKDINELTN